MSSKAFMKYDGASPKMTWTPWTDRAATSLVASFANGIIRDSSGSERNHFNLVERSDRGPDHQAETHQAPDVRPRETRFA